MNNHPVPTHGKVKYDPHANYPEIGYNPHTSVSIRPKGLSSPNPR